MSNGLNVALRKNPAEWSPKNGDRYLDIAFADDEWGSFFYKTLCAANPEQLDGELREDFWKRREIEFHNSLSEYLLLRRINEFYQDAFFSVDEMDQLIEELYRAAKLQSDGNSDAFLSGMLEACKEAKASNTGIWLASS
ncbi:MAG: hypothetical protein JNL64_12555 [Blastocatellia bacterium]|nr:hypothetical protein [Blastocatellia bacterium]